MQAVKFRGSEISASSQAAVPDTQALAYTHAEAVQDRENVAATCVCPAAAD